MGFGRDLIEGAEESKVAALKKEMQENPDFFSNEEVGNNNPKSSFHNKTETQKLESKESSIVSSFKKPDMTYNFDDDESPAVAIKSSDKLVIQAKRLVQEVADFKKWSVDKTKAEENRCLREPQKIINELEPILKNEILPARKKNYYHLKQAKRDNPDKVVFLLLKGSAQSLRIMDTESAGDNALLDGAILESVPFTNTPFKAPVEFNELPVKKSPKP